MSWHHFFLTNFVYVTRSLINDHDDHGVEGKDVDGVTGGGGSSRTLTTIGLCFRSALSHPHLGTMALTPTSRERTAMDGSKPLYLDPCEERHHWLDQGTSAAAHCPHEQGARPTPPPRGSPVSHPHFRHQEPTPRFPRPYVRVVSGRGLARPTTFWPATRALRRHVLTAARGREWGRGDNREGFS